MAILTKQNIFRSTICSIILITVYRGTNAAPTEDLLAIEDIIFKPSADEHVNVEEFTYPVTERKAKRQTKENMGDVTRLPRLSLSPEKARELLRLLNKPKKSEILMLNGWSANGMPFNVLYTPNTLQQKFLSSLANAGERRALPVPTTQPLLRENYVAPRKEDKKEYLRSGLRNTTPSPSMRKHYLVIPQLFVSYGWGSIGK